MTTLPAFCSDLDDHWLLPWPLADARMVSLHFSPSALQSTDFQMQGIVPIDGQRKRQSEYLAGRLCAREALYRLNGQVAVPGISADRAPQWPAGISGSITHSHSWAAAVAARKHSWQSIGLDAEGHLSAKRARRLQTTLLTPDECQRLQHLPDDVQIQRINLSFSLKESLFKALYPLTGVRFYFQDAELLECTEDGQAQLQLLTDLSPQWLAGRKLKGSFRLLETHLLTLVAIASDGRETAA